MTSPSQPADKLLARQYAQAVRMHALLSYFESLIREKLGIPASYLKRQGTAEAEGVWLDTLAKRFELKRPYKLTSTAFFFGFDGNPQSTPFNQAPFRPDGDTLAGKIPVSDSLFRALLKAATGRLRTNGQQDDVNSILWNAYPGSYVLDGQDMTMTLVLSARLLDDDLEIILQRNGNIPKPAGVKLTIVVSTPFGFDGAGTGFDDGPFALEGV